MLDLAQDRPGVKPVGDLRLASWEPEQPRKGTQSVRLWLKCHCGYMLYVLYWKRIRNGGGGETEEEDNETVAAELRGDEIKGGKGDMKKHDMLWR